MFKIFKKNNRDYLPNISLCIFVFLILPLFFYKLGQSSLISWDEAWYAEVARNILKTGNIINLAWNNLPFIDHPPTGFWLMAITLKIFGVNEFWVRFPSAVSGIISIFLLYLLGKKLFNPIVGLSSAVALSSATWFIFRSRSGNLDIFLTMFFLLSLLLAIKTVLNKKYLIPLAISLVFLFLTKSMVPLAIIPALFLIFYQNRLYKWHDLVLPALIFLVICGGWFILQIIQYPNFIQNYFGVGLRGFNLNSNYFANLKLTKDYLYNGIGKWFWLTIFSLILSIFLKQKRFFILIIFFLSFILPIIFSPKIQIWHLIPLFPILLLIYFGFTFSFLEKYLPKWKYQIYCLIIFFSAFIYFNQIQRIWFEFIDIPAFVSDEEILSKEASKYPYRLIIDGEYRPSALFYSEKGHVTQAPKKEADFFSIFTSENKFLLITNKWRLDKLQPSLQNYEIIKEDRDQVLILHK